MTDSHNIITITPEYVFFNYRGKGCYRANPAPSGASEREVVLAGYSLIEPYFTSAPSSEVTRAVKEIDEQISWIGQGELF